MASNSFRRIALAQGLLPMPSSSLTAAAPARPTAEEPRRVSEAQLRQVVREVSRKLEAAEA